MAIGLASSVGSLLSEILERLCVNLQLGPDQVLKAGQGYHAVTQWLADEESAVREYDPLLYPQGSLALDTTVRPIYQNEFDLDIICRLTMPRDCTPEEIYELVWDRMWEHGTYRKIMQRKERCIRLNYAESSQFHLDIVPAIADLSKGSTYIQIPDAIDDDYMIWKTSHPKGFAVWFESRKVTLVEKFARATIEPLRQPAAAEHKDVLTKAVQILKRWRDVKWKDNQALATPSIILTYLAAQYYGGETLLTDAMATILAGIEAFIQSGERYIVSPANHIRPAEVISEKWLANAACYDAFANAITALRHEWNELLYFKRGTTLYDALAELFGEPATRAIKSVTEPITTARANGSLLADKDRARLLTSTPAVAVSAVRVKPNTHFGN